MDNFEAPCIYFNLPEILMLKIPYKFAYEVNGVSNNND